MSASPDCERLVGSIEVVGALLGTIEPVADVHGDLVDQSPVGELEVCHE